jgi:type I site-specific restriction endonuclease
MNKRELSERDFVIKFILPDVVKAGWNKDEQVHEEVSFANITQLKTPIPIQEITTQRLMQSILKDAFEEK